MIPFTLRRCVCVCMCVSEVFVYSAGIDVAASRSFPASWRSPLGRRTGPHPGGRHWAAAAPALRRCLAIRNGCHGTAASAAASASGKAARTLPALTRTRWPPGTKPGGCRGGCRPCSAELRCLLPEVCLTGTHWPPGLLQDSSQGKSRGKELNSLY